MRSHGLITGTGMHRPFACLQTLIAVAAALLLAGCGGNPSGTSICFSFQDLETEFWAASYDAITKTLRGQGVQVIERNASEDVNRQLEQVRDCIAQDVDGIIMIPQDGESANTIVKEANRAGIPIGVFNRPMADSTLPAVVVIANNEQIAEDAVAYMAELARERGGRATPLVMVGDLGDRNAVARRDGFYNVIRTNPDLFNEPVEVPTRWDAATALANLEAALQANPDVDFIFTSSDFMIPQIRAVLEPMGRWRRAGEAGHVILGGLDGDQTACRMVEDGYLDATGVQDLYFEADAVMDAVLAAIEAGHPQPDTTIRDPGFALTRSNFDERSDDTWGCMLRDASS